MIIEHYSKNHQVASIAITVNKGCREFLVSIEKPRYTQFTTFPHDQFREALRQFDDYKAEIDGKNKYLTVAILHDLAVYLRENGAQLKDAILHLVLNMDYDVQDLLDAHICTPEYADRVFKEHFEELMNVPQITEEEDEI